MENLTYVIGQALGIVAVILGFISYQRKTQFGIIISQCATALVFSAHYFLISAPTAVALNFFCLLLYVCFLLLGTRSKAKAKLK